MTAPACCTTAAPPYSGYRQDGDTFTCSTCLSRWVWVEDEAEGGSFVRDTWGVADTSAQIDGNRHPYQSNDELGLSVCDVCGAPADKPQHIDGDE